ncbi:MAG TPA: hypothetical protein PKK07_01200 [bacterium]|nr:hypothetical protein [bacterium]
MKTILRKGQILVAAIVLAVLSLTLGVVASSSLIKRVSMRTQADDLSKALAAAEGAAERMLVENTSVLEEYINYGNCGSACTWQVQDLNGQIISAQVSLSYAGETTDMFDTEVETDEVFQLNLNGYTSGASIDVCWNTPSSIYASYIKNESGTIVSTPYAHNAVNTSVPENNFDSSFASHGFSNCFTVTADDTPLMLRVRPMYLNARIYFVPQSGQSIPKQGILITSVGTAGDAVKKVKVLKSTAIAPIIFDYSIFQKSPEYSLSNSIM